VLQTSASARIEPGELARAQQVAADISRSFDAKMVGQSRLRESLLVGLLAGGHILLESVPGLAKTTAAQTVAEAVSAEFRRIRCTTRSGRASWSSWKTVRGSRSANATADWNARNTCGTPATNRSRTARGSAARRVAGSCPQAKNILPAEETRRKTAS
jgi:transposase